MSPIERAIIATITYFDVFEYPLTLMEVWKWLYNDSVEGEDDGRTCYASIENVSRLLEESTAIQDIVSTRDGFYFLKGKEQWVRTRKERYLLAERKFRRAFLLAKFSRYIPFVRLIAVCNSLGYSNARNASDIDFFIIASGGHIWSARLCIVWILKLFRLRPRKGHTKDTLCFSFFLSDNHFNVSDTLLSGCDNPALAQPKNDIYFTYWLSQITPLYDEADYYERFWNANKWIKKTLPHSSIKRTGARRSVSGSHVSALFTAQLESILSGGMGKILEKYAKTLQIKIMPEQLKQLSRQKDTRVVINDDMLKMHYNDRRYLYWSMWRDKLAKINDKP